MKKIIKKIPQTITTFTDVEKFIVNYGGLEREFSDVLEALNYEAQLERISRFQEFYKIKKIELSKRTFFIMNYIPHTFTFNEVYFDLRAYWKGNITCSGIIQYPCKLVYELHNDGLCPWMTIYSLEELKKAFKQDLKVLEEN